MEKYLQAEIDSALQLISSTISKCEKMQVKFAEGTSQYSLLKNRIKALNISKALIGNEGATQYTQQELEKALSPVVSIINKTEKAQMKYSEGTAEYRRFNSLISAMYISKAYIKEEINNRAQ